MQRQPVAYLDQNVIGLQQAGDIDLSRSDNIQWVYSKEHFAEIRRSHSPELYLSQLALLNAKLLDLELNSDWKITGTARVIDGTAHDHYASYMQALAEVAVDDTILDPFTAWLNGGGDEGLFKDVPTAVAQQVSSLLGLESVVATAPLQLTFQEAIDQLLAYGNDIETVRAALGVGKGAAGSISGENPLTEIWNLVAPYSNGLSSDQFFGFEPVDKQGCEKWPKYLGIVGCCAVLDLVGFQAEKKGRRIEKVPNVRSDAAHIAMAAYCNALVTADKRLAWRAAGIYKYKGIETRVALLSRPKEPS
jgi:hypothetical protein